LYAFNSFFEEKLADGGTERTLLEVLINWELENQSENERAKAFEAIRLGLLDMYAGRTVYAFTFVQQMRRKFQSSVEPGDRNVQI
jgi:hypothetical protein